MARSRARACWCVRADACPARYASLVFTPSPFPPPSLPPSLPLSLSLSLPGWSGLQLCRRRAARRRLKERLRRGRETAALFDTRLLTSHVVSCHGDDSDVSVDSDVRDDSDW